VRRICALRRRHDRLRPAGVDGLEGAPADGLAADEDRNLQRETGVELGERGERALPDGGTAELEQWLVGEGGLGASSRVPMSRPCACALRNESLDVFSRSRRTR
jgi:hypothetical protein